MNINWHDLIGQTITRISAPLGDADIEIHTAAGGVRAFHQSDCCESVDLVRVEGDPALHIGLTVTAAEDDTGCNAPDWDTGSEGVESCTWTKLTLSTAAGVLTFWVFGQSNGYYSETLSFGAIEKGEA